MRFQPKTEAELDAENLLAPGTYSFTVLAASDKNQDGEPLTSKKGAPMMNIKLNVHGPDRDWHVYDYLSPAFMAHKLRHFAFSVGIGSQYEAGEISASRLPDRTGFVEIDIEPAKGGYAAKNKVVDYVVKESKPQSLTSPRLANQQPATNVPTETDDVPF